MYARETSLIFCKEHTCNVFYSIKLLTMLIFIQILCELEIEVIKETVYFDAPFSGLKVFVCKHSLCCRTYILWFKPLNINDNASLRFSFILLIIIITMKNKYWVLSALFTMTRCFWFTSLTSGAFADVSHLLGPKWRHITPLISVLHYEGVVGNVIGTEYHSTCGWEILIVHSGTICPLPLAVAIDPPNEPSISSKSHCKYQWETCLYKIPTR